MRFAGSGWPWYESALDCEWSRPLSAWAGFFGAMPYGLGVWLVLALVFRAPDGQMDASYLVIELLCVLPLMPFVVASAWIDRKEWSRVVPILIAGLGVGMASILLFWFAGMVLIPAGALGLIFGLVAFLPCWCRGDAAGRAMSLLGPAPAIVFFLSWALENGQRWMRTRLDVASLPYPFLTNRQLLYAMILLLSVSYTLILYWAYLRKFGSIKAGVKIAGDHAPFALAGAIAGGSLAAFLIGMIGVAVFLLTRLDLYECAVSGGIAGAVFGSIGSHVAEASGNFAFVSRKVAAISIGLIVGIAQILFWTWWGDSFTVLAGGLTGLQAGILTGSRMSSRSMSHKKSIDEL